MENQPNEPPSKPGRFKHPVRKGKVVYQLKPADPHGTYWSPQAAVVARPQRGTGETLMVAVNHRGWDRMSDL